MNILGKLKRKKSRILLGFLVTAGGILTPQNVFAEEEEYVKMPYELSSNEEFEETSKAASPSSGGTSGNQTEDSSTKESEGNSSENKSTVETDGTPSTEYSGESPNTTNQDEKEVSRSISMME